MCTCVRVYKKKMATKRRITNDLHLFVLFSFGFVSMSYQFLPTPYRSSSPASAIFSSRYSRTNRRRCSQSVQTPSTGGASGSRRPPVRECAADRCVAVTEHQPDPPESMLIKLIKSLIALCWSKGGEYTYAVGWYMRTFHALRVKHLLALVRRRAVDNIEMLVTVHRAYD